MDTKPYIVITSANSWGYGETEKEALRSAHQHALRKEYELVIWHMHPTFVDAAYVGDMGDIQWDWSRTAMNAGSHAREALTTAMRLGKFKRTGNTIKRVEEV
jgi:hypothetical protein